VQHFGDASDTVQSCGICDVCNPSGGGSANAAHQPDEQERRWLRQILGALEGRSTSTGKLFTDLHLTKDRSDFDTLLDALARAGLISIANDTFRNPEGKDITYKKAAITHEGRDPDEKTLNTVWIRGSLSGAPTGKKAKARGSAGATRKTEPQPLNPQAEELFEALRAWRTEVARPTKTPAFMILSDAVMRAIAAVAPTNLTGLHAVSGMGPAKVDRYGAAILAVCRGELPAAAPVRAAEARTSSEPRAERPHTSVSISASASAVQPKPRPAAPPVVVELNESQRELEERLKQWRRTEAAAAGLPSFFIFSDTVLREIVFASPDSVSALTSVRGVGPEKVDRFGAKVVEIVKG
jgi:ATP-dependent DNA helicase RecQ